MNKVILRTDEGKYTIVVFKQSSKQGRKAASHSSLGVLVQSATALFGPVC